MSREELIDSVLKTIGPSVAEHGFQLDRACRGDLVRGFAEGEQRISPELFRWPSEVRWHLTFRLKVRFDSVERMLRDYKVRPARKPDPCVSAVNRLIDNLYPKTINNCDWEVLGEEEVRLAADAMAERLRIYALPFFESLNSIEQLRCALEREDGNWPTPTAELRAAILLICLILRRDSLGIAVWLPKLSDDATKSKRPAAKEQLDKLVLALRRDHPDLVPAAVQ